MLAAGAIAQIRRPDCILEVMRPLRRVEIAHDQQRSGLSPGEGADDDEFFIARARIARAQRPVKMDAEQGETRTAPIDLNVRGSRAIHRERS